MQQAGLTLTDRGPRAKGEAGCGASRVEPEERAMARAALDVSTVGVS